MDTTLKQRLIGAVVLIALAVIFLPMLVQGPAPDSGVGDVSLRVPDAPAGDYQTRELPLAGPSAIAAQPAAQVEPAQASPAAPTEVATPASSPSAAADPAVAAGDWAVSFGAYSTEKDASAVRARLTKAGLKGFIEQDELNGRKVWRVRVGPYADRALAEAGRLQAIRVRDDVKAQVIALNAQAPQDAVVAAGTSQAQPVPVAPGVRSEALPAESTPSRTVATQSSAAPAPARAATAPSPASATTTPKRSEPTPAATPATEPAASSVGFAVQMGAFASQADANALRDQLRAAGFSALVQPVRTDKGTLNRVRVGPVASREEANQLKARVSAKFGAGNVVSHP